MQFDLFADLTNETPTPAVAPEPQQPAVVSRFLRYVQIDTQSDPQSATNPSTEKQKDLSRLLVQELHEMGIADADMDEWGYVYATIPANTDKLNVPVICFCSHVDTSPDVTGTTSLSKCPSSQAACASCCDRSA